MGDNRAGIRGAELKRRIDTEYAATAALAKELNLMSQ
jgi:hypothetical protein